MSLLLGRTDEILQEWKKTAVHNFKEEKDEREKVEKVNNERDGLGEVGWYGSGCQVSSDTRPTGGISALASLSFHCQYIPSPTTR